MNKCISFDKSIKKHTKYTKYNVYKFIEEMNYDDVFGDNLGKKQNKDQDNKDLNEQQKQYIEILKAKYKMSRINNVLENSQQKSENFEVLKNSGFTFKDVGGYENVKVELLQIVELLDDYLKYESYNIRTPKGVILEGPPGNGKTLLVKGLAGEINSSYISVSGSSFQEKYVGVGASRIRELFDLANKNKPCMIFIDEIDAVGRKRTSDDSGSASERDNTLNELLVALDGFKSSSGIFLIGATNRIDLLDPALIRPGRIDKKIYIGMPDKSTRKEIIQIHIKGKPTDITVNIDNLVDIFSGLSGAEIENTLNEAILFAIRNDKTFMTIKDIEYVLSRLNVGWQPNEHIYSSEMIDTIAIHEMGHAIVGLLCKNHKKLSKVCINLYSPRTPGYTIFEHTDLDNNIYKKEALFSHLMVLLGGRIAEEVFFGVSISTGASSDIDEAYKLAEKMIIHYGMGRKTIYPHLSDKSKEIIDEEINSLLTDAYNKAYFIVSNTKEFILECSKILIKTKELKAETIHELLKKNKYNYIWRL